MGWGGGAKGGDNSDFTWGGGGGGDSWKGGAAGGWGSAAEKTQSWGFDAGKGGKGASKGWDSGKDQGATDSWGGGGKGKDKGGFGGGFDAIKALLDAGKASFGAKGGKGWDSGGDAGYDSWGGGKGKKGKGAKDKSGPQPMRLKFAGRDNAPSDNLYISGIPSVVDEPTLKNMFESNGYTVQRTRIMQDALGTGYSAACVQVGSIEEAQAAIAQFMGQVIEVEGHGTGPAVESSWGKASGKGGKSGPYSSDDGGMDQMWSMLSAMMGGKGKDGGKGGKGKGGKDGGGKGGSKSQTQIMVNYAGRDHVPSDNLFVGNLPSAITEQAVRDVFANQGLTITSMRVLFDSHGKGTCGAMVRLTSQPEAEMAISLLNGTTMHAVPEALAQQAAGGKGAAGGPKPLHLKYAGRDNNPSENLYVTGLPSQIDDGTLIKMFTDNGFTVTKSKVIYDEWGTGYSAGLVAVGSAEEAAAAIQHFSGQVIQIEQA
eukprot:TRINITY_DN1160_c1_g1_i1.p1 TRINITY_DN1160_c1_g1~~TRINITY_DN1160_c1_g1_i1.p1  ORF type:complete len:484 (-),score=144.82 TRINITY_DN1160_c1_g1_i1:446-1897(-)